MLWRLLLTGAKTGRIVFGIIGDCVNLSAKLEKHTKAKKVHALAAAEVLRTARAQNYSPPRNLPLLSNRSVEGVAHPVDLVVRSE